MGIISYHSFQKLINNLNIEVLEHGHFIGSREWQHYNMSSPYNRLYFALAGEAYVERGTERVYLKPGNIYLIPMYTSYNFHCESYMEQFYIHFRTNVFNSLDIFTDTKTCLTLPLEASSQQRFLTLSGSEKIEDVYKAKAMLYEQVGRFIEHNGLLSEKALNNAIKYQTLNGYIKAHINFNLSQAAVADYLGIPLPVLQKGFKKDMGTTLKKYMDAVIIQAAKEKLLTSDLSIKEIAYELGFSDEFYFSRFFAKKVELSPRKYKSLSAV